MSKQFAAQQAGGFFGIHAPSWHAARLVLVGNRGLFVVAPVLLLAAAGLVLLWRRGARAESLLCGAVSVAFLVLELGYYDPYGGDSPGPRFFIPALPFLALGLAPAFARWRVATALFAAASVLASTAVLLTWPAAVNAAAVYRWSVWRELALFPARIVVRARAVDTEDGCELARRREARRRCDRAHGRARCAFPRAERRVAHRAPRARLSLCVSAW